MLSSWSFFLVLATLLLPIVSPVYGAHVTKKLTITCEKGAPNGQSRYLVKVNGEMPGPALVFDEGDDVEIIVHNLMPQNTTVHWHGLELFGTPWSDGVPGLSQTPIEPGETFIYRFKAYPGGQYWYHAHSRATLLDGLYGSLFIRHKPNAPSPFRLISKDPADIKAMKKAAANPIPVLISDWNNVTSDEFLKIQEEAGLSIFCTDSILVNGKGNLYCPGQQWLTDHQNSFQHSSWEPPITVSDKGCFPYIPITEGVWLDQADFSKLPEGFTSGCAPSNGGIEVITVDPQDKWASINFINAATFKSPIVGIDMHSMWIYEVDGQYIVPQQADTVSLWAGERYSALIKLNQPHQDYPIRIPDSGLSQLVAGYALLRYKTNKRLPIQTTPWFKYRGNPTTPVLDYNGDFLTNGTQLDKNKLPPFPPNTLVPAVPKLGDQQHFLILNRVNVSYKVSLNNQAMYLADRSAYNPLLFNPYSKDANDSSLVLRTINGTWQDIVLQVAVYEYWPRDFPHPIHKHGSKMWQIGRGDGIYNYSSVAAAIAAEPQKFNLVDPPYRDTFLTDFTGPMWIALRYQVTNPGAWLLHCHIESHIAMGMALAILDGLDKWPKVPVEYQIGHKGVKTGTGQHC